MVAAIPGYAQTDTLGLPQLPLTAELVALPPGAHPTLEIVLAEETDLPLSGPLALAPQPAGVQRDAEGNVIGGAFGASMEAPGLAVQGRAAETDQPVTLALLGTMRGVALARIAFSPVRPVADHLRATTHVQVVLRFNTNTANNAASELRRFESAPSDLADVDPWMGETAADNRYALLDGDDGGDILPDLLVGRLPVNTITETQTVVDKIVRYATAPYPGGWNSTVLLVADDADEAGDFAADSDQLAAAFIHAPFIARPIYYAPPAMTVTDTQQAILARWNAGAGLVLYHGHSSVRQWAAERLFHRDDVATLRNAGQLPVVLQMTCFTGLFHEPSGTTLDETLLRVADGGAVAVWGATGLGVATGHHQLAQGFLAAILQRQEPIGAATLAGKLALVASGASALDLLDTFTLLGDPATILNQTIVPWTNQVYLPVVQRALE